MPFTLGQKLQAIGEVAYATIEKARGEPGAEIKLEEAQAKLAERIPDKSEREILFMQRARALAEEAKAKAIAERKAELMREQIGAGGIQYTEAPPQPVQAGMFAGIGDYLPWIIGAGIVVAVIFGRQRAD